MSSHIHSESGEKSNEKKVDGSQHNPPPNTPILAQQSLRYASMLPQAVHGEVPKGVPVGVKALTRPIAPAPGLTAVATTKILQGQHTIMPKSTQTVAVNLSTQTASSNMTGSQPLHITMSSQSIQSVTLPPGIAGLAQGGSMLQPQYAQVTVTDEMLNKAHEDKKSRIIVTDQTRIPASPLMRTLPHSLQQAPTQVNLTLAPNPGVSQGHATAIQTTIISTMPPSHIPRGAAAASALAAPKISTVANPQLRPSQPVSTVAQIQQPLLQTLSQNVQLRQPLRPSFPATQILTTTVSAHHQADLQRASAHMLATQSTVQGRPVYTQVQATKGTLAACQPIVQGYTAQAQKSQLLAPVTSSTNIITASKLTGPNIALNLTQTPGGATRTQKITASQLSSLACSQANSPASLVAGGQMLSLNQSAPRPQKVGTQGSLPQSVAPTTIVVNATTKQGVPGQRPQKVVMSPFSATTLGQTTIPITTAAIPKSSLHGNTVGQAMTVASIVATTATSTQALPKKAVVKVPTQRPVPHHVALTTTTHAVEHTQIHRDVLTQGQGKLPLAQASGHVTQQQTHPLGHIPGNMFTIPATRPPLVTQAVVSLGMSVGQVTTTQAETRPQQQEKTIRPGIQPVIQTPSQLSGANYGPSPSYVWYNSGTPLRPSIVPGQQANIAVTLQAAPQGTLSTATAVQPGARIHQPVMVSVDPAHANAITMATQFVATKEAAAIVTTMTTPVIQGPAISHPVGATLPTSYGIGSANQQTGSTVSQPTNASPRPSILRKRPHDSGIVVKKNLLSSVNAVDVPSSQETASHVTPAVSPKPPPPVDPTRENSQSSTDTASSAESTPQSNIDARVKEEPTEAGENDNTSGIQVFSPMNNNIEASPRKKPRKQRLEANHEMQDGCSSDEELEKLSKEDIKKEPEWAEEDLKQEEKNKVEVTEDIKDYIDEEGVRWTREKRRPPISLLNHYVCSWKTRNNHFLRYSDVKPKEERRPTVNELANQKGIHQKASGWKMYHLAAQLEELMDLERDVFSSMTTVQESIAPKHIAKNPTMEDDISMVHELTQGNIQRCQLVMDQLEEARVSMVKVLDHKQRIIDIINKHHSKRPVKKKERT